MAVAVVGRDGSEGGKGGEGGGENEFMKQKRAFFIPWIIEKVGEMGERWNEINESQGEDSFGKSHLEQEILE